MIKHSTLREKVVEEIRKDILKGVYKPGQRINESEIAVRCGISRGPVREALRQLEQEGLITYSINRGCSVADLTKEDIWELYTLRAELEGLAIKWTHGKLSEEDVFQLKQCISNMKEAGEKGDVHEILKQDHLFHEIIIRLPKRKNIYKLWTSLNSPANALYLKAIDSRIKPLNSISDFHQELFENLIKDDENLALESIQKHYIDSAKTLIDKLKTTY